MPKFQSGTVIWDDKQKRFRQSNTGWVQRTFGQESIGNPVLEAQAEARRLEKQLKRKFGDNAPSVSPLIVFTNLKVEGDERVVGIVNVIKIWHGMKLKAEPILRIQDNR